MDIKFYVKTTAGKHSQNCDFFVADVIDKDAQQGLFGVFDGVNSLARGAEASRISGSILQTDFANSYPVQDFGEWLQYEFNKINRHLLLRSKPDLLLTTASVLSIHPNGWNLLHCGDSRIFIIDDNPSLLTEDQTLFNDMVKKGQAKKEDKLNYPQKNVLMQSLGQHAKLENLSNSFSGKQDTQFLLSTDGISDYLELEEMVELVSNNPFDSAFELICELAEERGSQDDKTLMYIRIKYA